MSSEDDRSRRAGPHNPFPDLVEAAAAAEAEAEEASEQDSRSVRPTCLFCGHDQFTEEIGKLETRFGFEAHKMRLLICTRCAFTMHFSLGRGINV